LAHDLAHHWNLRGDYAGALKIATALEPHVSSLPIAPLVQCQIARAAGGLGDTATFVQAVARVDEMLSDPAVPEETAARTLLGVAHGAFNLGDYRGAAGYAEEAMSIARKRSEGRVALEAEALMEAARRANTMPKPTRTVPVAGIPPVADDFVRALDAAPEPVLATV
jgi:hypothetical protein